MHDIHSTWGVVLSKRGVGEAHTLVSVLTPALGLLRARATSTRVVQSKLRYGIEPLTLARFAFVKGRHEWRLVQVGEPTRLFAEASVAQRAAAGRVAQLLLRLIHGQEQNAALYDDVVGGFKLFASAKLPAQKSSVFSSQAAPGEKTLRQTFAPEVLPPLDSIEVVLVLRVLARLGYLPHTQALAPFVDEQFSVELSSQALASRGLLIRAINEALQATGL